MSQDDLSSRFDHTDRRLEHLEAFARDTADSLKGIGASLARLEANKPFGAMQLMQFVITLFVLVGGFVGAVSYVTSTMSDGRIKLLEYRIEEMQKREWMTKVR